LTKQITGPLILIVVLIAATTVFLFFMEDSSDTKIIKNYPSTGANIIAFGNSLVFGTGSAGKNDFVSVLSRKLEIPISNLGKRGDTTSTALTRLNEVLDKDPKIVMILLGGNDFIRKHPKQKTFSNLEQIIKAVQSRGAIVMLLGIRGGILFDSYKDDFQRLSDKYQTAYIPNVLEGLIRNSDFMHDSIHPNNKGYSLIADRIYPVLKKLVN